MKVSLSFIFILAFFITARAQDWSEEGEIEDAEVVIEKNREIELPKANRNFERIPPLPVQKPQVDVTYSFVDITPNLEELSPGIRVLKIKDPPLPKLYGNYARIGAANYITPYLELFVNNTRSRDYSYGVHLRHLSSRQGPVDGANSGNSDTRLMLNGKYFARNHTFSAEGGYERERYHYYGYAPVLELNRDSIRQIYNIGHLQVGIQKSDAQASFTYGMQGSFDRIGDRFGAVENQLGLALHAQVDVNEDLSFRMESESYLMGWQSVDFTGTETENVEQISRNLIKFKPYLHYKPSATNSSIEAKAGFNIAYENDTIENGNRLHFYPFISAAYYLTEGFSVYGNVEGDIQKVSWLDLTRENSWIASDVELAHTNKTIGFQGGVRGRAGSVFGFHAGVRADNYKNMYYYVNSAQDSTRFDVIYDTGNTFLLNLFGEFNVSAGERFRTTLRGDYYHYTTDRVDKPWHKPALEVNLLASYNLYEKILFNTELMVLSGIEGYNMASGTQKTLEPILDMSFKMDYLFSSRFSTFLQLKNIFAQNYERYLNYPSRGIMVMLGATYSF